MRSWAPTALLYSLLRPRVGVLLLGLVLILINRLSAMILPASMKFLVDDVLSTRNENLLLPLVAAVLAGTATHALTSYSLTRLLSGAAQTLVTELREKIQEHIGRLPVSFYDGNKSGALVSRVMNDVEGLRHLVGTGVADFFGGLITAAVSLLILLRINPQLALLSLAFLGLFTCAARRELRKFRPLFRKRSQIQAEVTGRLTESLAGARVIKAYRGEAGEAAVFSEGIRRLLATVLETVKALSLMTLTSSLTFGCAGAIVMYVGARSVLHDVMTLGDLVTFSAFLLLLSTPAMQVIQIGSQFNEAMAGLDRCREVLCHPHEDENPSRVHALGSVRGDVRFEEVWFAYEADNPVLHGISFEAPPGSTVALVGSSGSGKSTITNLVASFHTPQLGRVRIDGIDLSTVALEAYRTQLGVVLQETFLFDGTIRENVIFARPRASQEEVLRACRLARVDEFADRFEHGYDTIVGERGIKLSGGQKQRVSIARAILADPRILILDEATSSLDSESEALIQEGLSHLMGSRTTFVIAHRLSTIRRADQILVLEGGVLVERGTHETLYEKRGRYYDLYIKQHGADRLLLPIHA